MRDDWTGDDPVELVGHIVRNYHQPLDGDLRRIRQLVDAAGPLEPRFAEVRSLFLALEAELRDHMDKEEQVVFPMIERGEGDMADGPIEIMGDEHVAALEVIDRLRALCDDYVATPAAHDTVSALYKKLAGFEAMMREHIRLEDELLFPMVLE